jgi:glucokinase
VDVVVALDVGGTTMKGALVTSDGHLVAERELPTRRDEGPARVVERILDATTALAEAAGPDARAIGLAVPGAVDEEDGVALASANLGWRDVPLRELVRDRSELPVRIAHDIRSGGVAEDRAGAGRPHRSSLFVPIGTGIGGAFVLDGQVLRGANYRAVELGHVPVRAGHRRCGCGRSGCLETVASASAIARAYAERTGDDSATAADVAARVRAGDPDASAVWDVAIDALAGVLVTATTLFDPAVIIVGGGLSNAGETLLAPLGEQLRRGLTFERMPVLAPAELGGAAGCLGAAMLAWDLVRKKRSSS